MELCQSIKMKSSIILALNVTTMSYYHAFAYFYNLLVEGMKLLQ